MIGYTTWGADIWCPQCAVAVLGMDPADAVCEERAYEVNRWDCDAEQTLAADEERIVELPCIECGKVLATFEPISEDES